ncbi:MAG TPA: tetratricopeptide repeat protein [Flavobacteriales bacterium]|nr:tetratricopeptide repeat protein [Flavobacteriales bacterium]
MKKVIVILLVLCAFAAQANTPAKRFETAEKHYKENKFNEALNEYSNLEKEGYKGVELYYNMANCYYKMGQLGLAIAYLEKAMKIDPADEDVVANLAFVDSKLEYKVKSGDKGLTAWFNRMMYLFSADGWTRYGLILWVFAFLGLIAMRIRLIKRGLNIVITSWIAMVLGVMCLVIGYVHYNRVSGYNKAVLVQGSVNVKESPADNAKTLGTFHEGARFKLHQVKGEWYEVSVDGRNHGWVRKTEAELI